MRIDETHAVTRTLMQLSMLLSWVLFVALCGIIQCTSSGNSVAGGFGSETTNGITAAAKYSDGHPAVHATVRIRFDAYDTSIASDRLFNTTTDDSGVFRILDIPLGRYVVEINDNDSTAAMARCVLTIQGDTAKLPEMRMLPYTTVNGFIDSSELSNDSLYVQIRGLERKIQVDNFRRFSIGNLPAGNIDMRIVRIGRAPAVTEIANVAAIAGEQVNVFANMQIPYTRRFYINTTPNGAGVSGNVARFPLLVRLDSTTLGNGYLAEEFFAQVRNTPLSVQFLKPDGTPLPREIESWDSAHQQAIMWVLIDTVYGNNTSQFILMTWGDSAVTSPSNGTAVFDTANGFMGVWHLSETAAMVGDSNVYKDATAGYHHGTDVVSDPGHVGLIGKGKTMDGVDDFITIASPVRPATVYTISAWVNLRTISGSSMLLNDFYMASTTLNGYFMQLASGDIIAKSSNGTDIDCQGWATGVVTAGVWTYLVAQWDTGSFAFYKDGVKLSGSNVYEGSSGSPKAITYTNASTTQISNWAHPLNGSVDEVRAAQVIRSADWIKLEFETQRLGSRVIMCGSSR